MENTSQSYILSEVSQIDIGLNTVEKLERQNNYREAIATFRSCMEHFINLTMALLCRDLKLSPEDVIVTGGKYLSVKIPKEGSYKKKVISFKECSKSVYIVTKDKPKNNSAKQLRDFVLSIRPPYVNSRIWEEYTSVFNQCSDKASHDVRQLTFKEYDSFTSYMDSFKDSYYHIVNEHVAAHANYTKFLSDELDRCIQNSSFSYDKAKQRLENLKDSIKELSDKVKRNINAEKVHQASRDDFFKFVNKLLFAQIDSILHIEELLKEKDSYSQKFSITVVGPYSSGKTSFINLLTNKAFETGPSEFVKIENLLYHKLKITELHIPLDNDEKGWGQIKNDLFNCDLIVNICSENDIIQSFNKKLNKLIEKQRKPSITIVNVRESELKHSLAIDIKYNETTPNNTFAININQALKGINSESLDFADIVDSGYYNFYRYFISFLISNASIYKSLNFNNILDTPIYEEYKKFENHFNTLTNLKNNLETDKKKLDSHFIENKTKINSKIDAIKLQLNDETEDYIKHNLVKSRTHLIDDWRKHVFKVFQSELQNFYKEQETEDRKPLEMYYSTIEKSITTFSLFYNKSSDVLKTSFSYMYEQQTKLKNKIDDFAKFSILSTIKDIFVKHPLLLPLPGIAVLPALGFLINSFVPLISLGSLGYKMLRKHKEFEQVKETMVFIVQEIGDLLRLKIEKKNDENGSLPDSFLKGFYDIIDSISKSERNIVDLFKELHGDVSYEILSDIFQGLGYSQDDYVDMVSSVDRIPNTSLIVRIPKEKLFSRQLIDRLQKIFFYENVEIRYVR